MSETSTESVTDLEELLDAEIRCEGLQLSATGPVTPCGRPAVLRSDGHGCSVVPNPPYFKCLRCWQAWYVGMVERAARRGGYNRCACGHKFPTPSAFSDYRPF